MLQPRLPRHFHTSKNLRLFYLPFESVALRISVSKKNFKLAVSRNKIKRQIKDIFKKNNLLRGGAFVVLVYKPFDELKYLEASVEIVNAVESLYQKGT